jgi:hypothetical protein
MSFMSKEMTKRVPVAAAKREREREREREKPHCIGRLRSAKEDGVRRTLPIATPRGRKIVWKENAFAAF